jgi:glutathione S-transferase
MTIAPVGPVRETKLQVDCEERQVMDKPEIIGSLRSTYTRVACMVCEEKGIEYVLTERPLHAPEIRAIHPFGKMPVLRHGDVEIFESKAIATWLDRRFPAPFVFPSEPRLAALTEQWVSLVNTVIDRTLIRTYLFAYIALGTADGKPNRAAIDAVMPAVREQVAVLDKAVAKSGHLVGEQFTFADINLMPILHRLQQAPEGAAALADAKHLAAYYARHATRPSFTRTDPPPGPPGRATAG